MDISKKAHKGGTICSRATTAWRWLTGPWRRQVILLGWACPACGASLGIFDPQHPPRITQQGDTLTITGAVIMHWLDGVATCGTCGHRWMSKAAEGG